LTPGLKFSGANVSLDARAFSRFGLLRQTAIAGTTLYKSGNNYLRLESTYSFSLPERTLTGSVGDIVSGSLQWTRPIRMGGVQVRRDFTLQADVVRQPVPVISGTAAVPSTVDVYVNGLRSFSQTVNSGPFNISNLQNLASGGTARVVVRDASGRQVEQQLQLNPTALLLRPGLTDFSVEGGLARRNFGILSNDYDRRFLASASLRHGFNPNITLEAHAEGGAGLINAGVGAVAGLGAFGSLQLAVTGSRTSQAGMGYQIYADWSKRFNWMNISLSGQHTFGKYEDLASVTARYTPIPQFNILASGLFATGTALNTAASFRPPRTMARLSVGMPLTFDKGSVSANLIYQKTYEGVENRIASLSYNRPLPFRGSLFVSGFADFGTRRNYGLFAGVNFPLSGEIYGSANVSRNNGKLAAALDLSKPQPLENNTYGWRVRAVQDQQPLQSASASYRSSFGQAGVNIDRYSQRMSGTATFDGSIAVMGGGVALGNKVHSSFAMVSAGQKNVPVTLDNRAVGMTNWFGKLLVPNLRAHQSNSVGIDTTSLPANYDASNSTRAVSPQTYAGVHVDFSKNATGTAAVVVFKGADGKYIEVGSKGKTGSGEDFIVGYDGRAYIRQLAARNSVMIDLGSKDCKAEFPFSKKANTQVQIDDVVCR
jgi:outer membrane usher protein